MRRCMKAAERTSETGLVLPESGLCEKTEVSMFLNTVDSSLLGSAAMNSSSVSFKSNYML